MIRINNTQNFHFLEQADVLRRSGSLCDAIISVKSQTFQAHRLVLACASKRLAQQLAQGGTDSPVHCTLEYFSPRTFQQVLDFTYAQPLEVSAEDLHLLLRAAQLLEIQSLEDQCRKQLDNLHHREREEITVVRKEDKEENLEDQNPKEYNGQEEKLGQNSFSVVEEDRSINTENGSPYNPIKKHISPPKRPKVSPVPLSRDSVITSSSLSTPWSFPANMWSSMSTLKHLAEYSNLVATHPLHPQSQILSSQMFPLLGGHFQSSVMGYSSFYPRYTQNFYARPTGVSNIIKQGVLKRKKPSQRAFAGNVQSRYQEEIRTGSEEVKPPKQCSKCRTVDSTSSPSETCTGCGFCGRAEIMKNELPNHRLEHRGEKPYHCQLCPKKFSLKHQLDTHHRVHTGEKPFECRLCGQRSRDYSAMIKHLRTHGGAAPYQCTVCLEFCNSLVAMQRHVKGHAVQDFPPDWSISSTYLYTSHI